MVGRLTGRPAGERVYGSIALAILAVLNGARIVRVHDVGPTVDALKTVIAVEGLAHRTRDGNLRGLAACGERPPMDGRAGTPHQGR
jgi:dihydropteroate synthase